MKIDPQNREEKILVNLIKPRGKRILEIGCGEGGGELDFGQIR